MSDKPILFSGPMVRALLAGTKTQTRRVLTVRNVRFGQNPHTGNDWYDELDRDGNIAGGGPMIPAHWVGRCRHQPGDRLYVRETWCPDPNGVEEDGGIDVVFFADHARRHLTPADGWKLPTAAYSGSGKVTPLHMPRWASRITLHVTEVRVQRLHDISEADARAEGVEHWPDGSPITGLPYGVRLTSNTTCAGETPQSAYQSLWQQINGLDSWTANPWVAAYTFTVERRNIDGEEF